MKQRENRTGAASVILNVIGAGGIRPTYNYIAGATANAGLIAFTEALGAEAAADAIRVVGVNPGMVHVLDIHECGSMLHSVTCCSLTRVDPGVTGVNHIGPTLTSRLTTLIEQGIDNAEEITV